MSSILFLIAVLCSYLLGYTKKRGEYLELREDFRTLVHEDAHIIAEYRTTVDALNSHINFLEKKLEENND